jgi:Flp pilus assembly protein TadG
MLALYRSRRPRCGAQTVEMAIVCPVAVFIILGLIVGGMGVSRYQEVSHLAREGARYASTHGGMYQKEGIDTKSGVPAISTVNDPNLTTFVAGQTVLLVPAQMTVGVDWTEPTIYSPRNMPTYVDTSGNQNPPGQIVIRNYVKVTVTYQWLPEMYLTGPINLTCTCEMPMTY